METDIAIIDDYLAKNNIDAQTTESGMRYTIIEEGTGPKPEVGDMVRVNYTGNVLEAITLIPRSRRTPRSLVYITKDEPTNRMSLCLEQVV